MSNSDAILLGIDFGSGGCKVTAIEPDGAILGTASVEYPTYYAHQGWSEQEPADWYKAMCAALAKLRSNGLDLERTRAIAFDGSTHNAVLLDAEMRPLRRTIMWTDQRSTQECAELNAKYRDQIFNIAYQCPTPTWTLPQMMWLKAHEPEVLKRTKHVLFVKDYVRYQVCGAAATDYIEAQGTLFFDMRKMDWSDELVALSGLPREALPKLIKPTDGVGEVSAQAAAEMGVPAGTAVICGTSDSAVEDYGAGAIAPGDCIVKLATAGNVNVMTAEAHPYPTTLTYSHVLPGMWYTVAATNAAALCQRWFRDLFYAQDGKASAFEQMSREAESSSAGANGVFFHPYLQGERSPYWDANLRGSFTGLAIRSTRGDFNRALLEGVAFSLLDCYGQIEKMGLPIRQIFLIGGGAKSRLWSEIVCNVFNLPVKISSPGDASFGSALLAGTGIGLFKDSREAVQKCLKIERDLEPDSAQAAFYQAHFARYKQIHDALAPIYAQMNSFLGDKDADR
jgi:xylulokinase